MEYKKERNEEVKKKMMNEPLHKREKLRLKLLYSYLCPLSIVLLRQKSKFITMTL
jgi:hypothetical protein